MSARRPLFLLNPLVWLPGGLVAVALTLTTPLAGTAQAGMIGTGSAPRVVAIGDLNEDGYADLVSGNNNDSTLAVSLGRGNGTFKPKVQYSCGSSAYGVVLADLNGDAHLDAVSCCPNIGKVGVRFGAGDGTLGPRTDYSVNTPMAIVVRDLSEDGLPDLAISSASFPYVTVMLATAPGTYGPQGTYPGASGPGLAVGDLNNDGDLDLVTANSTGSGFNVYLCTFSPGVFGLPVSYAMQGASYSVALADFNHDGALDVAASIPGSGTVNVRLGVGDGTFGANNAYATGAGPSGVASADFNGDTHPDLAIASNAGSSASVLLGTGSGTFQPKVDYAAGMNPLGIALGQLDGDANIDLAIAAGGSNSICTLPGNGNGTFQVPSGPVYVWAPASGTAFDPNAWLPVRNSGTASDILVFNRGGAVTVSSVPSATIGQLVISGGTEASFSGFLGAATLTVAGGTGDDAVVEHGSKTILASSGSPVSVNMASGATGVVSGDAEIRGGNNRLQALDANGLVFQSTGRAIIGAGSSATPFGDGTGASGLNSVLFQSGSKFIAQTTVAVFAATAPNAVVVFAPGSRFRMDVAFTPSASGRTYADFEYNVPGGNNAITGGNAFQVDSLIVTQGTFTVAMTGPTTIRGNLVISACAGANQLVFAPSTPATYTFGGSARQLMYSTAGCFGNGLRIYASPNVTFNVDNPAGVFLTQGWRTSANFNFTHGNLGNLNYWQVVTDSTSTITGASQSTGWVQTDLTRRVTANGPVHFDIGDSANYLPIDIDLHGLTTPGYVLAGTYAQDHPDIGMAQLDLSHLVHRFWVLTASNDFGNILAPTFFSSLDATFPFLSSDVDPGSDPFQFELRMYRIPGFPWRATTPGVRTATSTQALGLTAATVDSFETLASGQPITPSLSVFNASGAEGNGAALHAQSPPEEAVDRRTEKPAGSGGGEFAAPFRVVSERRRPSMVGVRPMQAQSAGSLSFRVRLSQAAVVPISVDYETVDGTATEVDGDYAPTSGTLNFAAGDTALDIVVPFGVDATPERNETFGITITNASNATIDTPAAIGTILDDDDLIAPTAVVTYPNGGELILQNQQVNLQWTASDNVAVSGVDIQLLDGVSVTTLASNHPNTGSYLWSASGPASTTMKLRVVAHDDPGHTGADKSDTAWELSAFYVAVENELPLAFALRAPSPNPSPAGRNPITFAVPHEAHVRLTVHDLQGRTLATLADGTVPAGRHVRFWDSSRAAAAVYFLRFEAPGFHAERRLVVVR